LNVLINSLAEKSNVFLAFYYCTQAFKSHPFSFDCHIHLALQITSQSQITDGWPN